MTNDLIQERQEFDHDVIPNKVINFLHQEHNWLIPPGFHFLDGYKSGAICFHLHISIKRRAADRLGEFKCGNWCFVVGHPNARLATKFCPIAQSKKTMRILDTSYSGMQESMLIDVRQMSENGKGMMERILPSCIWLQRLNDCQYIRSDSAMNLRQLWLSSLIFGPTIENGELCLNIYRPTVFNHKLTGQVVKGSSDVLDVISKDNPKAKWWLTDDMKFEKNQMLIARLYIRDDFVRLAVEVSSDFLINSEEMLVCPVEFEPDAERYCHDVYLSYEQSKENTKNAEGVRDSCTLQERVCG